MIELAIALIVVVAVIVAGFWVLMYGGAIVVAIFTTPAMREPAIRADQRRKGRRMHRQ